MIWLMDNSGRPSGRIYLDHAAATPLSKAAREAMLPYLMTNYGNASAIHAEGRVARQAVEEARAGIARVLGVRSEQIFFTGSGTESNNLAVLGRIEALRAGGRPYETMEVLMTEIEHPSLLSLRLILESRGVRVRFVPVTAEGVITRAALTDTLSSATVLVAFAYVNSEIGTIQSVSTLVRFIRDYEGQTESPIFVHLDAAQAPLWVSCYVPRLGVDSLAFDAGKCGGSKGVGILVLRKKDQVTPIIVGGGQEQGLRPGTENVAGIVGAATALVEAQQKWPERHLQVQTVREAALAMLPIELPDAVINGPRGTERVANNINFSLPGLDTEYAVIWLDKHGVSVSTKSACAGAGGGLSYVVYACTQDEQLARHTLRLTLGEETTVEDMRYTFRILAQLKARQASLTN